MKRLAAIIAAAALLVGCAEDRSEILKVYNWSTYIDEEVLPDFEQWYEEQTGEKIRVIYQTFDINEAMLAKIEKGHEDYDLVCPSDYIIERMLRSDLLLPLNRDFGDTPNYIDPNLSPFMREAFNMIDGRGKNANDYSVCYMWGTTGTLYNAKYVSDEEASTTDVIHNPKFKDKILVKDAARDIYGPVLIYLRQDDLKAGRVTQNELMYDSSDESLAEFEAYMKEVSEIVAGWEADFGKEHMTQEHFWINFTWSGDAVWAIEEAAELGVDLRYEVPKEGSTFWFDGWVIPKYAKNVKAASYFINFMCRPDIMVRNVDVTGYVSSSCSREVLESQIDSTYDAVDLSYFFTPADTAVHVNPVMYPDKSVMERCTLEHDWGDETEKLIATWSRIKGQNANLMTLIVIALFLAVLVALAVEKRVRMARRRSGRSGRRRKKKSGRK